MKRTTILLCILLILVSSVSVAQQMVGKKAPEIKATEWLNTEPLTAEKLKGRVILLEFWATW